MINDILPLDEAQFGSIGSQKYPVNSNTSGQGTGSSYVKAFRAGEPVIKALGAGGSFVTTLAPIGTGSSSLPVVATDFLAGIAISGQGGGCSTETDTAAGVVYVANLVPNVVYLGNADVTATYGYNSTTGVVTQSTYDALIGSRVLIKMSNSTTNPAYTILAADGSTNGLVVEPMDVAKYPGKVAFKLRNGLSYST